MIECMLATKASDDLSKYEGWIIEEKFDGVRAIITKNNRGVRIYGRRNAHTDKRSEYTEALPELVEFFDRVVGYFSLDCELLSKDFLTLIHKVRTKNYHVDDFHFHVRAFDFLPPDFEKIQPPQALRHHQLQQAFSGYECALFKLSKPSLKPIREALQKVVAAGGEGLILKNPQGLYVPGKRSKDWVKVLPYREMDVTFIEAIEGTGKYEGALGALRTTAGFKVGTGFDDALRRAVWAKREHLFPIMGKIQYKGLNPSGTPRMPVFLQFKED